MSKVKQFNYEDHRITFEFSDGNKMINATEMARPFGKLVGNFLKSQHAQSYIILLEERYSKQNIDREVLRVVKGGDATSGIQGTWMDEKLALKFAAWLSPEFELWVYDKIQELLITGEIRLRNITPSGFATTLRILAQRWEVQEDFNESVQQELDKTARKLEALESKILSVDAQYYTIAGYCNLHKIPCPIQKARQWGKNAMELSRSKNIPTGTAHDERFGKVRTYHQKILTAVIPKKP